ncbi:ABC-F family ATP-binding cassette domain-containing protein [Leucobacter chromiireducens]|uniref:ABC-F family ATP-binding cassette domain-containing protein n=1 Tax=Leucobacter chromiireducens TaxID=283877 RepID=UPI000F644910|nr:ABC-F family ATP-binding cassette domain-containing protein [Leucobacter chromiireducens]
MPAHHHSTPHGSTAPGTAPGTAPSATAADRAAARGAALTARDSGHLAVSGLSHAYQDRRVLTEVSFTAAPGDRIGLVGENGTGKSTLLGILAGRIAPTAGTVTLPGSAAHPASIGLLAQEVPYPADTPISRVLDDAQRAACDALRELERLGAELADHPDDAAVAERYAAALAAAERTDAWSAEAQRGEVVAGLGLGGIAESRPLGTLSGGQQLRLALAAILLEAPFVLLLDEPSNHLDDASAAYLERVLSGWPGIVILASHDRALLDAVTTRILDLDPLPLAATVLDDALAPGTAAAEPTAHADRDRGTDDPGSGFGARFWGMGYTAARQARQAELARWRERYAAESEEIAALTHEIEVGSREVNRKHESKSESRITRKFYADKDARVTARRARNARVRLDALERSRVRRPPEPLRFAGFAHGADSLGDAAEAADAAPVLRADRVAVAGRLAPTSLTLGPHDRLLLTGENGAGKSTLLAVLAGQLAPDSGAVLRRARIGFLPQEFVFPDSARTLTEVWREALGPDLAEARPIAASGLIAARDVDRAVGALSAGQRRRLALALLTADPPPVLLLDEPTNHLSLTLVEELESALAEFPGAIIIASHDRWLRERWRGATRALVPPTTRG